jgi:hypothetical protein
MFVQNIKTIDTASKLKKAKRKTADGDFSVFLSDSEEEQKSVSEVYATPTLNSMLFLQDVNSQQNIAKKNYERGQDILDGLENYRRAMVTGDKSADLQKVANQLKERRTKSEDANLENLIDEIELRAAVEAAKREASE